MLLHHNPLAAFSHKPSLAFWRKYRLSSFNFLPLPTTSCSLWFQRKGPALSCPLLRLPQHPAPASGSRAELFSSLALTSDSQDLTSWMTLPGLRTISKPHLTSKMGMRTVSTSWSCEDERINVGKPFRTRPGKSVESSYFVQCSLCSYLGLGWEEQWARLNVVPNTLRVWGLFNILLFLKAKNFFTTNVFGLLLGGVLKAAKWVVVSGVCWGLS